MARNRSLKPEFFEDEDLAELPFWARILFEGLWCHADREGRLEDRPLKLKAQIFPYDKVDVEKGLTLLAEPKKHSPKHEPFIVRYEVDGNKYIQIINFHKHQHPHKTERESPIPSFNGCLTVKDTLEKVGVSKSYYSESDSESEQDSDSESDSEGTAVKAEVVSEIEEIRLAWNEFAEKKKLPQIQAIKPGTPRDKSLRARMAQDGFNFQGLLEIIGASPFLLGENKNNWSCTFDWIICPSNYQKIMEGNYRNYRGGNGLSGIQEWVESRKES